MQCENLNRVRRGIVLNILGEMGAWEMRKRCHGLVGENVETRTGGDM